MKDEEERKSESGELVPEPRAGEGGKVGSFPRNTQADALSRGPTLLRGDGGGGTFDGNLGTGGSGDRSFLSQGLNLSRGEISFAGRAGGRGSEIAGGSILVGGGGRGRGQDLSSRGGHAKLARSQGRGFISSTSGSGGASNCRGGGARITSGGGEGYAAASRIPAQAGSNTDALNSGRAVGVELKSAEAKEGTCGQVGGNNNTVLTEMNPTASSFGFLKSPHEEMEILEEDKNGNIMVDLVADETQGREGHEVRSQYSPPSNYVSLPHAGTGSVAASLPVGSTASGSRPSPDTSAPAAAVLPSGGLEVLRSDEEPPLPIGMIGTTDDMGSSGGSWHPNSGGKPRVEVDVDDARPPPPPSTMEAALEDVGILEKYSESNTRGQRAASGSRPEHADGNNAPTPFSSAEFDNDHEHTDKKKPAARASDDKEPGFGVGQEAMPSGEDSICEPGNEEPEDVVHGDMRGQATPLELFPPTPFNCAEFDDDDGHADKKKPAAHTGKDKEVGFNRQETETSREDSICEPQNEEPEDRALGTTRGPTDIAHRMDNNRQHLGVDGLVQGLHDEHADASEEITSTPDPERGSVIQIPVAWRVSEPESNADDTDEERQEAVIIATPLEPPLSWWKQPNAKRFFALVCALLIAAAIALAIVPTVQPATSPSGSIFSSTSPSAELTSSPSASPTECARQIDSQVQTFNLQLTSLSEVALDGQNVVAIVQDQSTSATYARFYLLTSNDWIVTTTLFEDSGDLFDRRAEVALSDKTAFVGFPFANNREGDVSVYEQNRFGVWEKVEDPFVHGTNVSRYAFGSSVGIDGDLACVAETYDGVNLFRRVNTASTKWVQFKRIDAEYATCSIAGDTIAIEGQNSNDERVLLFYKYDSDLGGVVLLQDPISARVARMSLSNNHLVFLTWDDDSNDILIYSRGDVNQEFALHQQISGSYSGQNTPFAFDEDILVIGGGNDTRIFSEEDGRWEETLMLDRSYDDYQLSRRTLLVANATGVYSFNIEHCVQPVPTSKLSTGLSPSPSASLSSFPSGLPSSTPSPSLIPSSLPSQSAAPSCAPSASSRPSKSLSPSVAPSKSIPPSTTSPPSLPPSMTSPPSLSPSETCFFIEIDILTDQDYDETWWDVSSVNTVDGSQEKIVVYDSSTMEVQMEGKTLRGTQFKDSATDTSANGVLCNCGYGLEPCDCQGQVCLIQRGKTTYINKINHCEDGGGMAAIIYNTNDRPLFTPWGSGNITAAFIGRVDGQYLLEYGLGKAVSMTLSSSLQFKSKALHSRRVCLPEGDYEFTIYDRFGNGICCRWGDGHYKVTSNGALIKEGGKFGSEESTPFSIPFVLAPAPA